MKKFKILEIVFHILGFPLLIVLLAVASIATMKGGAGYGIPVFVGLLLTVVMAIAYYVAFFILTKQEKKRRIAIKLRNESAQRAGFQSASTADPGRRTGIVLAIVAVCCLTGLWVLVDVALPNPIATATSNTVYWEDLSDNWQARGEVHEELLEEFITRSFYAGNLKNKSLDAYLKDGIKNEEVKKLITSEYKSIDANGYATFIGPPINFAQQERMTIPALVHLLLDERTPVSVNDKQQNSVRQDEPIPLAIYKAVSVPESQEDLVVGQLYQYIRSNKNFKFVDVDYVDSNKDGKQDTLVTSDELLDYSETYLVVVESNVDYRKIQFLTSNDTSFVYTFNANKGFTMSCYKYKLDRVEASYVVTKVDNLYVCDMYEDGETNSVSFERREQLISEVDVFEIFGNDLNPTSINIQALYGDDAIKPEEWSVSEYVVLEKTTEWSYADWDVLDMLGDAMGFELPLSMIKDMDPISIGPMTIVPAELLTTYAPTLNDVLSTASVLVSHKDLLASKLTVSLNFDTGELSLVPCNVERGTLDYMRAAWLQNNGLLYVLVALFSTRKFYLIFAAVIALTSYCIGVMHELAATSKKDDKNESSDGICDGSEELTGEEVDA